jgi:septum formation protein
MKQNSDIVLASGSARRRELLTQIGLRYSVLVTDIDESRKDNEPPPVYVRRMALEKAQAGMQLSTGQSPVLGADTVVLLGNEILGKPGNRAEAADMLRKLSGRDHFVLSAIAMCWSGHQSEVMLNKTKVSFAEIPESFIDRYCDSDDPLDKAGAYAIQGEPGMYVSGIEGSYSGVMGLPLYETGRLLKIAGVIA